MKKQYEELEMEVIRFEAEDVITASACETPTETEFIATCDYIA